MEFLFQMYEFVPNTLCLSINASGVSEDPLTLYLFKPVGERVPYIDQAYRQNGNPFLDNAGTT